MKKWVITAIMAAAIMLGMLAAVPLSTADPFWDAKEEWRWDWSVPASYEDWNQVAMTPVVADLDGDDIPEVIFSTWHKDKYLQDINKDSPKNGILRAISGKDPHDSVFDISAEVFLEEYRVNPIASIAVADIDGDGYPEIFAAGGSVNPDTRNQIICFDYTGKKKWISTIGTPDLIQYGGPAVANDGVGYPEIIVGRTVLDSETGGFKWKGTGGVGGHSAGPLSAASYLGWYFGGKNLTHVVAGPTAYNWDGIPLWNKLPAPASLPDGFPGIADFDGDRSPEVVVVSESEVYLLDGCWGEELWRWDGWEQYGTGYTMGGAPTIADFDGDGYPEIGVADRWEYVVLEAWTGTWDAEVIWRTRIVDGSSGVCSASAFDFDGDGKVEIVYADEQHLFIFDGDGDGLGGANVLNPTPIIRNSATTYEMPVIADVDADGHPEIVVCYNNFQVSGDTGIKVYGNDAHWWHMTRPIWNQHTYHITNINDDGTIPPFEDPNVWYYNNFRCQQVLWGAVGGTVTPVNKLALLVPWIVLGAALVAILVIVVLTARRTIRNHSRRLEEAKS